MAPRREPVEESEAEEDYEIDDDGGSATTLPDDITAADAAAKSAPAKGSREKKEKKPRKNVGSLPPRTSEAPLEPDMTADEYKKSDASKRAIKPQSVRAYSGGKLRWMVPPPQPTQSRASHCVPRLTRRRARRATR